MHRFLGRAYRFVLRNAAVARNIRRTQLTPDRRENLPPKVKSIERKLHQTIKRVTEDFQGRWHFNTSVAAIMEFVNELYGAEEELANEKYNWLLADILRNLSLLLAPFAPFLANELWEAITPEERGELDLLRHRWPEFDPALTKEDEITYAVQINGKLRSHVVLPAGSTEESVRERVLADGKVRAALEGKQIVKIIVIAGKLVNVVVK